MEFDRRTQYASTGAAATHDAPVPGKQTLTQGMVQLHPAVAPSSEHAPATPAPPLPVPSGPRPSLQMLFGRRDPAQDPDQVHAAAARGTATAAGALPHIEQIQRSFGKHDVSGVQAHVGAEATASAQEMGAAAYATGNHVVLGAGTDLHTVAHEAAHVVQQRGGVQLKGGVGEAGDAYERHADAVADLVVQGKSAEVLLDQKSASPSTSPAQHHAIQHKLKVGTEPVKSTLTSTSQRNLGRQHGASPTALAQLVQWANEPAVRTFRTWADAVTAAARAVSSVAATGSSTAADTQADSSALDAEQAAPSGIATASASTSADPQHAVSTSVDAEQVAATTSEHAAPESSAPHADDDAAGDPLTALHNPALPFPGLLFFTHETTPSNVLIQLQNGGMKSRARLVDEGILKANQDTRKGGGYYVYTRMVGDKSTVKLGEGSKGSAGQIMVILSPNLATRNDWFTTGLDLMGRLPLSMMPTSTSGFPSSWTLINAPEAIQRNGKGQMTDTFGMPPDALKRAVDDQLTRPSAINEQGFFGGIPLSDYERIIVKRDRGPASTAAGPSSRSSEITSAADLIAEIRKIQGLEQRILHETGKARLEDLIVDKTKGQLVARLISNAPTSSADTQTAASSSGAPGVSASEQGDS